MLFDLATRVDNRQARQSVNSVLPLQVSTVFDAADFDGNGSLDEGELGCALRMMGLRVSILHW